MRYLTSLLQHVSQLASVFCLRRGTPSKGTQEAMKYPQVKTFEQIFGPKLGDFCPLAMPVTQAQVAKATWQAAWRQLRSGELLAGEDLYWSLQSETREILSRSASKEGYVGIDRTMFIVLQGDVIPFVDRALRIARRDHHMLIG